MSTYDRNQLRPQYPVFNENSLKAKKSPYGPPDLWPSGPGPGYSVYASAYGRNLAGVDEMNSEGIENYPNELDTLAAADDVAGNGVFDPNDTHGNIHPDEGVFNSHLSLPGYVDRDQFYTPSEVKDLPGGGNVMYVPGGATSFQQGQPETLRQNQLLWELPPSVKPFTPTPLFKENTVSAPTADRAVVGTGSAVNPTGASGVTKMIAAGVIGAGLGYLLWMKQGNK